MKNKAFTMIEVMMALVVISIMLAVMAPVLVGPDKSSVKVPDVTVNRIDATPVGVIVAWYGPNYPEKWLPMNGQSIMEAQYSDLRNALGGLDTLPNLNEGKDPFNSTTWIIKAEKE